MYLILSLFTVAVAAILVKIFYPKSDIPPGYREVPFVGGSLPIIGHGISFSKNIIGFISDARKKNGDIFKIRIFRKDLVICCDHNMKDEFFSATEDKMSLYDVLENLSFADAFADDHSTLPQIIQIIKGSIKIQFDDFSKKIVEEAGSLINRMKKYDEHTEIDLVTEMIHFVACTSARCFIGIELDDEFFRVLMDFTHLVNKLVIMTYFIPKTVMRLIYRSKLQKYRLKMINKMIPEIQKYRDDPDKRDSLVFREAVDYEDKNTGRRLTNREVGEVIICLLYVASENTAFGLSAALMDLSNNPKYWDMVKNETRQHLMSGDIKSLFASPILDACVMETARLNSHVFALVRRPKNKDIVFGDYYVGNIDCIALCEPMMMVYDCAQFKSADKYNPDRFLGDKPESKTPKNIMTWGAGVHLCPGKGFALYEIKTAIALVVNNFEKFKFNDDGTLNYFSPSAFSERSSKLCLKKLPESECITGMMVRPPLVARFGDNSYKVQYYEQDGCGGWLVRDYLNRSGQQKLFQYVMDFLPEGGCDNEPLDKTHTVIHYNPDDMNNSHCSEPTEIINISQNIKSLLMDNCDKIKFNMDLSDTNFNFVCADLCSAENTVRMHRNNLVGLGLFINIGASYEFNFGEKNIIINSGDVFITDFNRVECGIKKFCDGTEPGWFNEDPRIKTGRIMCHIQAFDLAKSK